jgi:hypothetical protein
MSYTIKVFLFALCLFLGMLLLMEVGRWIGIRRNAVDPEGACAGVGAIEGAVFALLGLLIAFTFSGAASRLETRRQLIVDDANAIGTAYLRIDLLDGQAADQLRKDFRRYVETSLEAIRKFPDVEAFKHKLEEATAIQGKIWNRAVTACREQNSQPATMLLLPALNQMIDIRATRNMARQWHPPSIIFAMLTILALTSALVAGYGMTGGKSHSWIHIIGFSAITAATIYVILDLEYPRLGLIQIEHTDSALIDLLKSMK